MATSTPWGLSDDSKKLAKGVTAFSTPGHGGVRVSAKRMSEIPSMFHKAAIVRKDGAGWFEEDCAAAVPLYFLVAHEADASLVKSLKCWYPDEWTAHTGEAVSEAESLVLRDRAHKKAAFNKFAVCSAFGSWAANVTADHVGVVGKCAATGEERLFLVHKDNYSAKMLFELDTPSSWAGPGPGYGV